MNHVMTEKVHYQNYSRLQRHLKMSGRVPRTGPSEISNRYPGLDSSLSRSSTGPTGLWSPDNCFTDQDISLAIAKNDEKAVAKYLSASGNPNYINSRNHSLLECAFASKNEKIVELLLHAGAGNKIDPYCLIHFSSFSLKSNFRSKHTIFIWFSAIASRMFLSNGFQRKNSSRYGRKSNAKR